MKRIADALEALHGVGAAHRAALAEHRREQDTMAATLRSIQDKLATQGQQLDQLTARKQAEEQAALDAIDAAVEANGAKMAAILAPADGAGASDTTGTV